MKVQRFHRRDCDAEFFGEAEESVHCCIAMRPSPQLDCASSTRWAACGHIPATSRWAQQPWAQQSQFAAWQTVRGHCHRVRHGCTQLGAANVASGKAPLRASSCSLLSFFSVLCKAFFIHKELQIVWGAHKCERVSFQARRIAPSTHDLARFLTLHHSHRTLRARAAPNLTASLPAGSEVSALYCTCR